MMIVGLIVLVWVELLFWEVIINFCFINGLWGLLDVVSLIVFRWGMLDVRE